MSEEATRRIEGVGKKAVSASQHFFLLWWVGGIHGKRMEGAVRATQKLKEG